MYIHLKTLMAIVFFLAPISSLLAIDINPGEAKTECPGVKIKLGGNPVAGPEPIENYTIVWTGSNGWSSSEPNPEIEVPTEKTTYTVKVTDSEGFTCSKTVVITPVKIKGIEFTPTNLPADGKSTATGKVNIDAPGRTMIWSITGPPDTDTQVDANTGVVTAGTNPTSVKIKAQDTKAADEKLETCYVEETICVGDPEKCCPDITGEVKFGPINAKFKEPIKSSGSDDEGYCSYETGSGTINLDVAGFFPTKVNYEIPNVTLHWKQKSSQNGMLFKEVKLTWTGKESTRKFGPLMAELTNINVAVDAEGHISGEIKFNVNQVQDVPVGGIAVLSKGTNGTFTYKYNNTNSFNGDYDFSGVSNIVIELKKGDVIAEAKGSLDAEGNIDKGKIILKSTKPFSIGGFKNVSLKKLNWAFTWKIKDNEISFGDGEASLVVKDIENTKGDIAIEVELSEKTAKGTAKFDDLIAFGCKVEGSLTVATDYQFDKLEINGKDITAKHSEFDVAFKITEFAIQDGKLTAFDFNGKVKYKKVIFTVSKASYVEGKGLSISAAVEIGNNGKLEVSEFNISGDGTITFGKIVLNIQASPLDIKGSLTKTGEEFKGTYSGKIKGDISIGGEVVLGATETYNYAYFDLVMKVSKGFPVGPVIRIDELGGSFGYNYYEGKPEQGTYQMGFVLGIRDAANLVDLRSNVKIAIGQNNAVELEGQIKVPAKTPCFTGKLAASYVLGNNEVSGSTNAAIKIPARDGAMLALSSGDINFKVNESGWSVNTDAMKAKFMDKIEGTASLNLKGSGQDGLSGTATGSLSSTHNVSISYPKNFDPNNCSTADNSDNALGFGIKGEFNVNLSGAFSVEIDQNGFVGSITANVEGGSTITVKWPCIATCSVCTKTALVKASGSMEVRYKSGIITLEGNLEFKGGPGESTRKKITLEF